jgi:hypothetical protein
MAGATTAIVSGISALAQGYSAVKQTEAYDETKKMEADAQDEADARVAEQKKKALAQRKQKIDLQRKQMGVGGGNFSTLQTGGTGVPQLTTSLG